MGCLLATNPFINDRVLVPMIYSWGVTRVLDMVKAEPREAQPNPDLSHGQFLYFLKDWLGLKGLINKRCDLFVSTEDTITGLQEISNNIV